MTRPTGSRWAAAVSVGWLLVTTAAVLLWPLTGIMGNRLGLLRDVALSAFIAEGLDSVSGSSLLPRLDFLLHAVAVLVAAVGFGSLVLRWRDAAPNDDGESPAPEWLGLAAALGLAFIGLATFLLGLAGLLGQVTAAAILLAGGVAFVGNRLWTRIPLRVVAADRVSAWCGVVVATFSLITFLGATAPAIDFDVKEYHLQGPKEWHEAGRIGFLEHNVYTSFPTLAEMHSLLQFHLRSDPPEQFGQLRAKAVSWLFTQVTALLLWGVGSRIGPRVGPLAALVWVTTPWTCSIAQIAYVEGPLCLFTLATFVAATSKPQVSVRDGLIAGLLAGAAAAVKYTGVVYVAVPLGLWLLVRCVRKSAGWKALAGAVGGGAVLFAPWLVKNLVETGNPVYPLAYSVFGGVDLDGEWAGRWHDAHAAKVPWSANPFPVLSDLVATDIETFVAAPFQSMLLVLFVPIGLWHALGRDRRLELAALFLAWIFLIYWIATHRIDRFWLPLLPLASLLAATGAARMIDSANRMESIIAKVILTAATLFHLLVLLSPLTGPTGVLADYDRQFADASPPLIAAVASLAAADDGRVLLIGEANVLDAARTPLYNTVFDHSVFHRLAGSDPDGDENGDTLAPAAVICNRLREANVTLVAANWSEVLRYRQTYRTNTFDTFANVRSLVDAGVLQPVSLESSGLAAEQRFGRWDRMSPAERTQLEAMGLPHLSGEGVDLWPRLSVYRVACE